jgi:Glycosyl hydrolase family 63 C-terminal domain
MTAEETRLRDVNARWTRWGPYLSERQWGTVREDYSANGDAWNCLSHLQARSRAYRWGEDGIAGISDDQQRLCFALAFWNRQDPILKERLFGLTNGEGNHGEDVKELYYYLDATPTHSYLKMLYKYPQREYPYSLLVDENGRRGRDAPEFELLDTGVLAENRYWDIFAEYAKAAPDDILVLITIHNRAPETATLEVLPQLWFRNTWSWGYPVAKPELRQATEDAILAIHPDLGQYNLYFDAGPTLLFCENETGSKGAFHEYVVHGNKAAVNSERTGTKVGAHYSVTVPAGGKAEIRARLSAAAQPEAFARFDETLRLRRQEADEFYADLQTDLQDEDARLVQRQAFAGLLWSKQFYYYDVPQWLKGDPAYPPPPAERLTGRNNDWTHLNNADVISMPDKWEYPWYAAWDLGFHTIPLALIDAEYAKQQLVLLMREWYMHPNGQFPAYEWNFSDVNPPVHAWAAWRVFTIDRKQWQQRNPSDPGDLMFLERVFHKLLLNFTWWVNRKDASGRNIFQGGFLGLDNIGVFDRSAPLPGGGTLDQSDGTSWMAMYSLNLLTIALELAQHNHVYEDIATKFFEHFLGIAAAMTNLGGKGVSLWDDDDGFFYDVLALPGGELIPLKVRSMVGLIPLFAVETLDPDLLNKLPDFKMRLEWYLNYRPDLASLVSRWNEPGVGERRLLSLLRGHRMKRILRRMLDPAEFLSDYGVRALSRHHLDHPYVFRRNGDLQAVRYQPGESDSGLFGGNSNWRGPLWFPMNFLIIESLQKFHHYYGDDFKIECPTGSGNFLTIDQVAAELTHRLAGLFLRDGQGRRPVFGDRDIVQNDPNFRDYLEFYEYFDGDNGRGFGASHQTGWTSLIAKLLMPRSGY